MIRVPDGLLLWLRSWRRTPDGAVAGRLRPGTGVEGLEDRQLLSLSLSVSGFPAPIATVDRIIKGPDGNLWFTGGEGDVYDFGPQEGEIGRITPAGRVTVFPLPQADRPTGGIAAGPDGNVWFTSTMGIDRITPAGTVTEFAVPSGASPVGITAGPDGNVWFTDEANGMIGRITPAGVVTEFPVPGDSSPGTGGNSPVVLSETITAGADGNLWFVAQGTDPKTGNPFGEIDRMTPSGAVTVFRIRGGWTAEAITAGPDGNLWFTDDRGSSSVARIGKITPAGKLTQFTIPVTPRGTTVPDIALSITSGPGKKLWFNLAIDNWDTGQTPDRFVGSVTTTGKFGIFKLPKPYDGAANISAGPDGALWYTVVSFDGNSGVIARFKPKGSDRVATSRP